MNEYVKMNEDLGRDKVKQLINYLDKKNSTTTNLTFTKGEYDKHDGFINDCPFDVKHRYNTISKYNSQQITVKKFDELVNMALVSKAKKAYYIVHFEDDNYLVFNLLTIDKTKLDIMSGRWSKVTNAIMTNYLIPNRLGTLFNLNN